MTYREFLAFQREDLEHHDKKFDKMRSQKQTKSESFEVLAQESLQEKDEKPTIPYFLSDKR